MRWKVATVVRRFLLGKGSISCAAASLVAVSVFLRESHILWRPKIVVKVADNRAQ
jgi:hypothetical protein